MVSKPNIYAAFAGAAAAFADLKTAIVNDAPINETVFRSLLPSQRAAWSLEPVGNGLFLSTNAFATTPKMPLRTLIGPR
jgi:hypothetical protein